MVKLIYTEITKEQRELILSLKQQNVSLVQISQMTGVKEKTIQSIKHVDRQTIYKQFEMHIIRDYFQLFVQDNHLLNLTLKQLRSFIKNKIKHEFQYETSHYQEFLHNKKQSNRQRILNKVVLEISNRIFNKQSIILGDDYLNSKMVDDQRIDFYDFDFEQYETQDNHLEQKDFDIQESYQIPQIYLY